MRRFGGILVIARYRVTANLDVADANSEEIVLTMVLTRTTGEANSLSVRSMVISISASAPALGIKPG